MVTHCVFFWAKKAMSTKEKADFERGLKSLLDIPSVLDGSLGLPAATSRPTVDRSYSYALLLRFDDMAAHDAYQIDPIHNAFHERCAKYWTKTVVYDFVSPAGWA
jgi:hypothetical protein